ncbi:hypothetical protein AVEN_11070-1 [Araneus ventricosus]|uniref:Uncharacterized protein n=1 Tax=Araneus ventricosus TaxID=182803 RepID=A0A4Y2QCE2_ARAVE|nr:hypothetical protein AVEN_11070-1 [Araneus ventricosus]
MLQAEVALVVRSRPLESEGRRSETRFHPEDPPCIGPLHAKSYAVAKRLLPLVMRGSLRVGHKFRHVLAIHCGSKLARPSLKVSSCFQTGR